MKSEFWDKHGYLLFNQSSQFPIFNVHDSCIFPMMSKHVSHEQAHWIFRRQTVTSRITARSDIYATDECVKALLHMQQLIDGLNLIS